MNDGGLFENHFHEIYPPELELKKEHGNDHASFLDLSISLREQQFDVKLFDKRDAFPFDIVRMPQRHSNIPSRIFYSAIGAEVLRIGRTSSNAVSFIESSKKLLARMFKQGASKETVTKTIKRTYSRHEVLKQFATNASALANQLLS